MHTTAYTKDQINYAKDLLKNLVNKKIVSSDKPPHKSG